MEKKNKILLSLGSNTGNKQINIKHALQKIKHKGFSVEKLSSFYETEPVGYKDQDSFINAAASGYFSDSPEQLLKVLLDTEKELGRKRLIINGPRSIDIDIILFGNIMLNEPHLSIPHKRFRERKFVLVPAAEIEKEMKDPVTGKTIEELLKKCSDRAEVKIAEKEIQ